MLDKITWSPGTRRSMLRKSAWWLTRCPAITTLPTWPGLADPGQWPGPAFNVPRVTPSYILVSTPIAGISILPASTSGSLAFACGGGTGTGNATVVVAAVVVVVAAAVVGAVVGRAIVVAGALVVTTSAIGLSS